MNKDQIVEFIESQIALARNGASVETNKLDLKRSWYKFKSDQLKGENEFLKDVTAIANSYGYSSGFTIIGVDEDGTSHGTRFEDCELKDVSELYGKIQGNIDRHLNIECFDHQFNISSSQYDISIIHIIPTQDKPHVVAKYTSVKNNISCIYPNEIFIRKGTTTGRATKSDLDLMYSEKNNVLMDRKVYISLSKQHSKFHAHASQIALYASLNIENAGYRPLGIAIFEMTVNNPMNPGNSLTFRNDEHGGDTFIITPNQLVKFNKGFQIRSSGLFYSMEEGNRLATELNSFLAQDMAIQDIVLILSDGEQLRSNLSIR